MFSLKRTRSVGRLAVGLPILAVGAFALGSVAFAATGSAPAASTCNGNANAPNPNGHAEALLANLNPSSGSQVTPGSTVSLLYTDETPIAPSENGITNPTVTVDGNAVTATVTATSGQTPNYIQPSDGGSTGTQCQDQITFQIPADTAGGNHNVSVTVYDGDNDNETVNFTYTTPTSTPTPTTTPTTTPSPTPKPTPPFVTSQSLTPNDEAFIGQDATGRVTFELFSPSESGCQGTPVFKQTVIVGSDGTAETSNTSFIASTPGVWRWIVIYSGDDTHPSAKDKCGSEKFSITNS
jgi:hypothetical protein